ncbi:DUF2339 domain-containing protein [Morganella morganii]
MDSLLFWGFVLVALIVVTPFIAVAALRRTTLLKLQVSVLTEETESLRRELDALTGGQPVAETTVQVAALSEAIPVQPEPEVQYEPVPEPEPEPEPVIAAAAIPFPADTAAAERKSPAANILEWLLNGNLPAKIGILLLFIGLSYLLKFSIENNILTPEVRLIGAAVLSVTLFVVGWCVRHKNRLYSLIVQGGSLGAFYITIFAAYKLYEFLPLVFALALMVVICLASVFFAVIQNAVSLAVLAVIGGYAAPVLLSTGSGNYIALFSYYLMLSVSILVMNYWQGWRVLNIAGFAFTFADGTAWTTAALLQSRLIQTTLAIVWALTAVILMTTATRRHKRHLWLAGAAVFAVVILKLFVVDMNQSSGLARAGAFIGVALLILVVGYFSPLPPKTGTDIQNNKEDN